MARKLDRARPFGTVSGDPEGRQYHQDGVYFDVDGNEHGAAAPHDGNERAAATPDGGKKGGKGGKGGTGTGTGTEPPPADPADDQIAAQINA